MGSDPHRPWNVGVRIFPRFIDLDGQAVPLILYAAGTAISGAIASPAGQRTADAVLFRCWCVRPRKDSCGSEQGGLDGFGHFRLGFANRTLGYRLRAGSRKGGAEVRGRLQRLGVLRESGYEHFHCRDHGDRIRQILSVDSTSRIFFFRTSTSLDLTT